MADDFQNQRQSQRVALEMWVEEISGGTRYFQRAGNLSAGGLFLEGTIPHPRGTMVELSFVLPGETAPVRVRAEIVGSPDPERLGMHARFVDLDAQPEVAARLTAFLAKAGG